MKRRQQVVSTYFNAIKSKNDEFVAMLIESGLVTTETTDKNGRTPLLAAVEAGNVRTVQQLMDFDAHVNAFGVTAGLPVRRYGKPPAKTYRTPLQLAAEKGNLTIVKLLMETYHADDSLIAPDGELALRLAASNGHREIVKYLPVRRGGGLRRWKTKHNKAMQRVKRAGKNIYKFFKFFLWDTPKFFLWSLPKHAIFLPVSRGAKWMYEHQHEIPGIIAGWLKKVWEWIKKVPRDVWDFAKKVPKFVWDVVKKIPSMVKAFFKFVWDGIKSIPKAARLVFLWIWGGIKSISTTIGHVFAQLFSFIHTALSAITSFFRNLTWTDVLNGLQAFLRAIFIDAPRKIWSWLRKFEEMTLKVFESIFGVLGCIVWWLLRGIVELFIYVPKKVGLIFAGIAQSMGSGCKEVLIWINPKRF
ncbi:ankyrin [Trematosphaeria pertusa]|uniref:Ankyrin n=1 Tax=Trematosphaeria pertusa TaxID=390896 RepID=A0A6A6IFY4_9PLEO|nr:ankyrin [Trematosphaeria pertusa]KAF2248968.1 ankyrin [Trematosphaeria pertusa]